MADFEVVSVEMHNCREGEQDKTDRCLPYFKSVVSPVSALWIGLEAMRIN